jgi:hypothetical protein
MRRWLLALVLALSASAAAQAPEPSPPPVMPTEPAPVIPERVVPANAPLPSTQGEDVSYFQRCFAIPGQVWVPLPTGRYASVSASSPLPLSSYHAATPLGGSGSTGSSGSSGGRTGGSSGGVGNLGDGKALLVIAVIIVAALPVVIYAIDDDAPAVVEQRFHCPTFGFDLVGGADVGPFGAAGSGQGRFTFGYAWFGTDVEGTLTSGAINSWAGHLLLRITPKLHIEPNIAFGFRWMTYQGATRRGLELGVPHRYLFWRSGLRQLGLELRPTFMFGFGTFDVGLEATFLIPLIEPLQLRAGGKVQTFGNDVIGGVNAGLGFSW